MLTKILAVLLAVAAFFLLSPYKVDSYTELASLIEHPYVKDITEQTGASRALLDEKNKELYDVLKTGILNQQDIIVAQRLTYTIDDGSDTNQVKWCILQDSPEIFWVNWSDVTYTLDENGLTTSLSYIFPSSEIAQKQTELDSAVDEVVQLVSEAHSDYEKVLLVHDYLVNHITYTDEDDNSKHTAYGALVSQNAVCDGYALAFHLIMQSLDIDCVYVEGSVTVTESNDPVEVGHAWNIVKIDGMYYQIDVTWDDIYPRGFSRLDKLPYPDDWEYARPVSHSYFLIDDEEMFLDHKSSNPFDLPACSDYQYFDNLGLYLADGTFEDIRSNFEKILYDNIQNKQYYIEFKMNERDLSPLDRVTYNNLILDSISSVNSKLASENQITEFVATDWGYGYMICTVPRFLTSVS